MEDLCLPPYRFVCFDFDDAVTDWVEEVAPTAAIEGVLLKDPSGQVLPGCLIEFDKYMDVVRFMLAFRGTGVVIRDHRQTDK